jgi:cellulose synthase/poly-beta-1,6-N-acetylglucosamine synthase-like glycosyltransferase
MLYLVMLIVLSSFFAWTYFVYPFALRLLKRYYKVVLKGAYYPRISIIIPTYNEALEIEEKIQNTLELKYEGEFEILVVDSNSSDNTVDKAKKFGDVRVIEEKNRLGKTHALNTALKETTGDLVIITDANCFSLTKNLLNIIAMNFFDPTVGAVAMIPWSTNDPTQAMSDSYHRREHDLWVLESSLDSVPTGVGEYFAFRKQIIQSVNPKSLADDFDISMQVRKGGYRIVYDPEAKVYEPAPTSFRDTFSQMTRRNVNVLQTLFLNRSILFGRKYGFYGAMILPTRKLFPALMPFVMMFIFLCLFLLNPLFFAIVISIGVLLSAISSSFRYFLIGLLANLYSWIKYLSRRYKYAWDKTPRSELPFKNHNDNLSK